MLVEPSRSPSTEMTGVLCSAACFIISSVAAYHGYYAKDGSLGVGKSSTKAIVASSILILMSDLIMTQLMLY